MKNVPKCQLCGGDMKPKTIRKSYVGLIGGLFFLGLGIVLCFLGPLALIGIPLILVALFGVKRRKVLKCKSCKAVIDRG